MVPDGLCVSLKCHPAWSPIMFFSHPRESWCYYSFTAGALVSFQPAPWQKNQDAAAAVTVATWQSKTVSAARQFLVATNQENAEATRLKQQAGVAVNRQQRLNQGFKYAATVAGRNRIA